MHQRLIERYHDELQRFRFAAFASATGYIPMPDVWNIQPNDVAQQVLDLPDSAGPFPQFWSHVIFFCRALAAYRIDPGVAAAQSESETRRQAEEWLSRSREREPTDRLDEKADREFKTWIAELRSACAARKLRIPVAPLIAASAVATVREFAGDPDSARLLSEDEYEILRPVFREQSAWGLQFSQMLGHSPSAQNALSVTSSAVCLLNLASDAGLGWMFGDVGYCTFFIESSDLARRDFDKAWGTIEGG